MSNVRTYNPSVRVGNWFEDTCMEEDTVKDFLDKREKGELSIQKASKLAGTVLKPVELSVTTDGFVHFGDRVMLMCGGDKDQSTVEWGKEPRQTSALAVNMPESKMHQSMRFEGPCGVSSWRNLAPCLRNVFVVVPVDNSPPGAPLAYGQTFMLVTLPEEGGNLFLHSDIATFNKSAKKSRQQEVSLVSEPSFFTHWKVVSFNPLMRMENEGLPVPANQKTIIAHCRTNQDLCVVGHCTIKTAFGREYEVTANTNLDSHRAEKDVNHWVFASGYPPNPMQPAVGL